MKIEIIDQNWLIRLKPLFSESYQEEIEIQDELDYFLDAQPKNWLVAIDASRKPIGFIRCFSYSNNNSFAVELYAEKPETELSLINEFDKCNVNTNRQIRFCLNNQKSQIINYLKQIGYTYQIEEFQTYILSAIKSSERDPSIRTGMDEISEVEQIVQILSHFGEISHSKIIDWISQKKIVICEKHNTIVAAALINELDDSIEIVELAVDEKNRRKGYAESLIHGMSKMFVEKKLKLNVNKENKAAIALYKKCGFIERGDLAETWLTKKFD